MKTIPELFDKALCFWLGHEWIKTYNATGSTNTCPRCGERRTG